MKERVPQGLKRSEETSFQESISHGLSVLKKRDFREVSQQRLKCTEETRFQESIPQGFDRTELKETLGKE